RFVTLRPPGTVTSFTSENEPRCSHPLDKPFAWALIKLDGSDTTLVYTVDAGKWNAMKIGMRVRVRWAEKATGTIRDIACFDPISPFIKPPVHLEFAVRPGEHQSQYLRALEEGRFVGGKCKATGKVYVPPRGATPE